MQKITLYDVVYSSDLRIRGKFNDYKTDIKNLKGLYITILRDNNVLDQNSTDISNDPKFWEWYYKSSDDVYDTILSYNINASKITWLDAILLILSPQNNITMRLIGKSVTDNNRIMEIYNSNNLTILNRLILIKQLSVSVRYDLIEQLVR